MANFNYEDKLIDAIEAIAQDSVAKAGYDKTIQCQIVECIDPTIGKYKVKYQDSTFLAYSGSLDISYLPGMDVYVLVPGNDMTRDKQILGTTKKLGANYAGAVVEEENLYEPVGNNCIDSNTQYAFCSYKSQTKIVYDKESNINELRLNLKSIETYIRNSSSILCGGEFKTKLPTEQQFRGNFGIIFELAFLDNASDELITRNYVMDVNHMRGNPYKQNDWTRQYTILNFDAVNFQYVSKITLFVDNFPYQRDGEPEDIWMRNFEFCGMKPLSDDELAAYGLALLKPYGTYFDENDADSAVRTFQAQVRVKGKNIDNNSQSIDYYWFVENVGIITTSPNYCVYGGQGWECKNRKNQVGTDSSGNPVYEWVPAGYEFSVTKAESPAYATRYKCVAVYNDIILTREEIITNYDSEWNVTIESSNGEDFENDIGTTNLVCKINNQIKSDANFTYLWAEVDSAGNFYSLGETTTDNDEYNNAVAGQTQLMADIEAERAMPAASQQQLNDYLTIIEKYGKIMRVEKMYLHSVQIREIVGFSTFKCSVFNNGVFIGSSSIVIRNNLGTEGTYSLIINNGSKTFKYDEMGISPVNTALDIPITLTPLTFTIYNNLGEALPIEVLQTLDIQWRVPASNTMLIIPDAYGEPTRDGDYLVYENGLTAFSYFIEDKYDITKTNNNIELEVVYEDRTLVAKTDFSFVKEGEPGTNGTEFAMRIAPNVPINEIAPLYPMVVNGKPDWNIRNGQTDKWFVLQFWHNGERIYNGFGGSAEQTTEGKTIRLKWSMLTNKYNGSHSDSSDITVTDEQNGSFSYKGYTAEAGHPANIVKCEISYEGVKYYATLPLITSITQGTYKVALKENTGFRYATYSPDGRKPAYDNSNPFELIVTKDINGYTEDVSKMTSAESVDYKWTTKGQVYLSSSATSGSWVTNKEYLIEENKTADKNQKWYKPTDEYIDECVNVALECAITHNGAAAANIHIPIHLLLNRYGQAAINDWDGNSIELNNNGGMIIAPQVGAGQKNADNSFTGVLMGKVKEANKTKYEMGLFGYAEGARSFFLNSEDGSAIFGRNEGQILIDPSANRGLIYSHNFWKSTGYDVSGKPTSYSRGNENGAGLLIDLTTPEIRFGSGRFSVTSDGHIHSTGGDIAGWTINSDNLYSSSGGSHISIGSGGTIEGGNGSDKWSIKSNGDVSFNSGDIGGWNIEHGYLYSGNIRLSANGSIYHIGGSWSINQDGSATFNNLIANGIGQIAGWTINSSSLTSNGGGVTLNANGDLVCSVGAGWRINHDGTVAFGDKLTWDGTTLTVNGTVNSKLGNIGGWTIGETELYSNNVHLRSGSGNTLKAIEVNGNAFYVQNNGYVHASSGNIGGWSLNSTGLSKGNTRINASGDNGYFKMVGPNGGIIVNDINGGEQVKLGGTIGLYDYQLSSNIGSLIADNIFNGILHDNDKIGLSVNGGSELALGSKNALLDAITDAYVYAGNDILLQPQRDLTIECGKKGSGAVNFTVNKIRVNGSDGVTMSDTFRAGEISLFKDKDITLTFTNGILTGYSAG